MNKPYIRLSFIADEAYVINMKGAEQRLKTFEDTVARHIDVDIQRFEGVNGKSILTYRPKEMHQAAKDFFEQYPQYSFAYVDKPSYAGCTASHYGIVLRAYEKGLNAVAAFEDDFVLMSERNEFLQYAADAIASVPTDFDVVSLHHVVKPSYKKLQQPGVDWCTPTSVFGLAKMQIAGAGTAAMVYHSRIFDEYLRLFEHSYVVSDYGMQHFYARGNSYMILPTIGQQSVETVGVESHAYSEEIAKNIQQFSEERYLERCIAMSCPQYFSAWADEIREIDKLVSK